MKNFLFLQMALQIVRLLVALVISVSILPLVIVFLMKLRVMPNAPLVLIALIISIWFLLGWEYFHFIGGNQNKRGIQEAEINFIYLEINKL